MTPRKTISRNPLKINDKIYFTQETENAIVRYNQTENPDDREKIFREYIHAPFDKLAENIINRFKFTYINQPFDDLKQGVVSFLVTNLAKYNQSSGKAFSYFSIIAKNYLIHDNSKAYKQEKSSIYISDTSEEYGSPDEVEGLEAPDQYENDDIKEFFKLIIEWWENNYSNIFKKERDQDIACALVELLRRSNTIEIHNKKYLYILVREMTNHPSENITAVVNKMKGIIESQFREYYAEGTIGKTGDKFLKLK